MIKMEALQNIDALETIVGIENTTIRILKGWIEAGIVHFLTWTIPASIHPSRMRLG